MKYILTRENHDNSPASRDEYLLKIAERLDSLTDEGKNVDSLMVNVMFLNYNSMVKLIPFLTLRGIENLQEFYLYEYCKKQTSKGFDCTSLENLIDTLYQEKSQNN